MVVTTAVLGVVAYGGRGGWLHAKSRLRFGFGDDGHGWTMHRYGESLLATLPTNALLISHTDLDWNTVRDVYMISRPVSLLLFFLLCETSIMQTCYIVDSILCMLLHCGIAGALPPHL